MKKVIELISEFIDGSAAIYRKKNGWLEKGLLLNDGSEIFFQSTHFGEFNCGLAQVDTGSKIGYINRSGQFVISPKYNMGGDFSEQRAIVYNDDSTILIDNNGKEIKKFHETILISEFSDGLARTMKISEHGEKRTDGFINLSGDYIIPCIIENSIESAEELIDDNDNYSEGLIRIKQNNKYGFIDKDLNIVIPIGYEMCSLFKESLAAVFINDKAGFIGKEGKLIIPLHFESALQFSEGMASVSRNGRWGTIDKGGNVVIDFQFDGLGVQYKDEIPFNLNGKYGIMSSKGEVIIDPVFDSINHCFEGIYTVIINCKPGVVNRNNEILMSNHFVVSETAFLN